MVSIIALLIALLVPALRSTRRQARLVVCASNLHHLSNAVHAYAADHGGRIPAGPDMPFPFDPTRHLTEFATGLVWIGATQQFSAHGLLQGHGLPDLGAIFCPDDRFMRPADQLANLRTPEDAHGTYAYRHLDQTTSPLVENLGVNEAGGKARALFFDFLAEGPIPLLQRSTHSEQSINVAYVEGHVTRLRNESNQYKFQMMEFAQMPHSFAQGLDRRLVALDAAAEGRFSPADGK